MRPRAATLRTANHAARLRTAASSLVCGTLRWSGLAMLIRKTLARRRVSILVYHDPKPQTLAHHLDFLARAGCRFRSSETVVRALRDKTWHEVPDNA